MGAMQTELSDKVKQKDVDDIVHKKYEDIVQYLQEALKTSEGEEESFARRAEDLEDKLEKIANSKADRMEVSRMTEAVATNEATLVRITNTLKEKERSKDMYTKKEIADLLDMKVDKLDYEEKLKDVLKQARKSKKMTAMTGGLPAILDDDTYASMSSTAPSFSGNTAGALPPGSSHGQRENNAWKGLADGLRDESNFLLTQNPDVVMNDLQVQAQQLQSQLKAPTLTAADKAAITRQLQQVTLTQQQLMQVSSSQYDMNRIPTNTTTGTGGGGGTNTTSSGQDFSQFVKSKKGGAVKGPGGNVMALPSNNNPGYFRNPTEGGQAGGDPGLIPKNPIYAVDTPVEIEYYPNVPVDARPGHDMSFLGGPYAGGGFNLRQGKLGSNSLKPMGMVPTDPTDIEGNGV